MNKLKQICLYAFDPSANNEKGLSDEEKYSRLGFTVKIYIISYY